MHTWLWQTIYAVAVFCNDRFLPNSLQLPATVWADRVQSWVDSAWLYLTTQNPGKRQYRGLPVDQTTPDPSPVITQTVMYRGCVVELTPTVTVPTIPAYIPPYQRWMDTTVRTWMLNLGVGNGDHQTTSLSTEHVYRGSRPM